MPLTYLKNRKELVVLAKTLGKSNTTLKQLLELEKDHTGIMIEYWSMYWRGTYPKFIGCGGWWNSMEAKEPKDETVSEDKVSLDGALKIADRLNKQPLKLDVDAMLANIIKENS